MKESLTLQYTNYKKLVYLRKFKRIELAARRMKTACLTTHASKTSTKFLLGGFYGQLTLAKMPTMVQQNPVKSVTPFNPTPS